MCSNALKHIVAFIWILLVAATPLAYAQFGFAASASYMMTNNQSYAAYNSAMAGIEASWHSGSLQQRFADDFELGLTASIGVIAKPIAGHRIGLVGDVRAPIGQHWRYVIGLGLSAYTNPYSASHNEENIFIGSTLNCLIDLRLQYRINNLCHLSVGLLHTSNGSLLRPNQGLNFLQMDIGFDFDTERNSDNASPDTPTTSPTLNTLPLRNNEVGFTLSAGLVQGQYGAIVDYYFCYDLSLNYMHYLSPKWAVGGSADVWFNFADRTVFAYEKLRYDFPAYLSVMIAGERHWGPLSLKAGIGPHIIASPASKIPFYERVGTYYNWRTHYVGVALNAHAGKIEFIEWSYGHRFSI
ncbi:MAG: acyloxyacyl hydrolase [Bacteroidales bacterium]|nr:acyloxyacyl hydrolase [Bacteroidales bacterium]